MTYSVLRHRWIKRLPVFSGGFKTVSTQIDKVTNSRQHNGDHVNYKDYGPCIQLETVVPTGMFT